VEDDDPDATHDPSLASGGRFPGQDHAGVRRARGELGDAAGTIAAGVHALAVLPGARLRGVSRLYATAPVGVTDQPEFRNAAVRLDVPTGPDPATGAVALLVALKQLERAFGRATAAAGGRASSTSTCCCSAATGSRSNGRSRPVPTTPRSRPTSSSRIGSPGAAVRPRPARRPRATARAAGWTETVATARARREHAEGAAAVRPIARWDGEGWQPLQDAGRPG
jgi:2-amino-4-hydroxy-6-hydroxymethyldihydropteridine diphosphokinase